MAAQKDLTPTQNRENEPGKKQITRRKFVGLGLTSIAVAGVLTFLKKCTKAFGPYNFNDNIRDLVECAFRLTDHNSLLNLEYYFINCSYDGGKVWAKYGPHENYMIVRLPQQHIAEQSFAEKNDQGNPVNDFKAATYISGYSYLVFRILFTDERFFKNYEIYGSGEYTYIDLTKKELLNWKDERKFRLVVRQDLTESLFELCKPDYYNSPPSNIHLIDSLKKQKQPIDDNTDLGKLLQDHLDNRYPFQQKQKSITHDSLKINIDSSTYDINRIPKAYGDPVTAIELPWRLIISPKLPDSSRFKFKWEIPDTVIKDNKNKHKLWTATLAISERDDEEYIDRKKAQKSNNEQNPAASTGSLNDIINQLELMILGSPDYPDYDYEKYKEILPRTSHRHDLVALYIKLKVLARTDKLTFSAIGATVKIHLKNEKIEDALKQGIGVIEWDQIISFGRDEKVEVSTLFLEAELGHKMTYIEVAERKLKNGVYPLVRYFYIMPLDIVKDYTNHITQRTDKLDNNGNVLTNQLPEIISRFNSSFKKITFLETKPKLLILKDENGNQKPFNQMELNQTETSFEFEAIDWHDNIIKFSKKINALPFGAAIQKKPVVAGQAAQLALDNQTIANIISPTDSLMYNPPLNPDSLKQVIPFNSRQVLDSILTTTNNSALKNTVVIDDLLKAQRDSVKNFDNLIFKSFPSIQESVQLESIHDWLETFIQLYKDYLDKTSKASSDLHQIIDLINKELDTTVDPATKLPKNATTTRVIQLLTNKYLRENKNFTTIFDQWYLKTEYYFESKSAKDFLGFLSISNYENREDFKDLIDKINADEKIKSYYDALIKGLDINENFKKLKTNQTFQNIINEWKTTYKEFYNKTDNFLRFIKNFSAYNIFDFIAVNSPELKNFITDLNLLITKDISGIIENIKQRIQIIYTIEEKAKQFPGLILLQKQKIGFAIKEKYDAERQEYVNKLQEATGQVKKSLSELESEYIIFKGGLRETENKIFDFFHHYAIIPQVAQAKVYVSALNKLVNEDLPISINYARDYLENQVRDAEFEVKQNASMVFAEVQQYSREQVKGLIQKIGDKMPGLNVEIPAHFLTYARNPQKFNEAALTMLKKEIGDDAANKIRDYSRDLVFISEDVKNAVKVMDDLKNADPKKYFKDLGAKLFGSIGLEDILDVGFDIPRLTELPDKIIYQVSTDKFKNFRAAFVQFTPHLNSNITRLELFISKNIKNAQDYYAYTQLNNFSVGVIIGGTEVLTVIFDKFKITSSPNQPKKTDVSITDVKLGGPLEFIAELAKKFMAPGNGMRIKPGPKSLSVDYTIALPDIKAPSFNFKNLRLVIGVNIPYDPSSLKAISFTFGVNKPEDKFLVSAGTYGGRGHFMLRATPKGIEQIDIAIELGAYATLDLGIGQGEVFLFFGFWFVSGKDDDGQNLIKAVAYVICAGSATVLGFITIGVSVLIALTYIKRGQSALFYGEAVVTYSVKIAFFKKEFSIRYYKEIAGSSEGNNTQSLQTGAIFLDTNNGATLAENNNEAAGFTDIFKTEEKLRNYLECFA